jgi:hypothetical protein
MLYVNSFFTTTVTNITTFYHYHQTNYMYTTLDKTLCLFSYLRRHWASVRLLAPTGLSRLIPRVPHGLPHRQVTHVPGFLSHFFGVGGGATHKMSLQRQQTHSANCAGRHHSWPIPWRHGRHTLPTQLTTTTKLNDNWPTKRNLWVSKFKDII